MQSGRHSSNCTPVNYFSAYVYLLQSFCFGRTCTPGHLILAVRPLAEFVTYLSTDFYVNHHDDVVMTSLPCTAAKHLVELV